MLSKNKLDFLYQRSINSYVLIPRDVIDLIYSFRQHKIKQPESAGILLGAYRGSHIELVGATSPGEDDLGARDRFIRKCDSHNNSAIKAWSRSNGIITYIGEWHTHPEDNPKPSYLDREEWANRLPDRPMIVLIQGIKNLWVGEKNSLNSEVIKLELPN